MKRSNYAKRRKQAFHAMNRKIRIARMRGWPLDKPHQFYKGKVHCSCDLCRGHLRRELAISDQKKLLVEFDEY